jgi:hypothetical protein
MGEDVEENDEKNLFDEGNASIFALSFGRNAS